MISYSLSVGLYKIAAFFFDYFLTVSKKKKNQSDRLVRSILSKTIVDQI